MSRTFPQIIMLNHAASTNYKNSELRAKNNAARDKLRDETDPVVYNGKRLSELSGDEAMRYYSDIV